MCNISNSPTMNDEKEPRELNEKQSVNLSESTLGQTDIPSVGDRRERILKAFDKYASSSSLHGVGFIHSSRHVRSKLIWIFAFASVASALVYHSYSTINDYFEYKTKISMEQKRMDFLNLPQITICNHNPIRLSKIGLLSTKLQQIILEARSENSNAEILITDNVTDSNVFHEFYGKIYEFYKEFGKQDRNVLNLAGHQFEDILLCCKISSGECPSRIYRKLFYSEEYSNCYTLNTSTFKQGFSGPHRGITGTKGIQMLVHSKNDFPYPFNGIPLSPGMMTYVALSQGKITRLGEPYSSCVDTEEYLKKYNYTYSDELCYDICFFKQYIEDCGCYKSQWNVMGIPDSTPLCEEECTVLHWDWEACSCNVPCREVTYSIRQGSAHWPSYTLGRVLREYLCTSRNLSQATCLKLRNQSEAELRENFVGVKIYYDSMYVTYFTDEEVINLTTFLSNLGGCVGLWIGISVFGIFELLYLVTNIFWTSLPTTKLPNRSAQYNTGA
ncbi:hypothetical protein Btru_051124 [Bulinus truncatus]|nr:hypothetical protein Btru_051124 [Bulinus truncatus]